MRSPEICHDGNGTSVVYYSSCNRSEQLEDRYTKDQGDEYTDGRKEFSPEAEGELHTPREKNRTHDYVLRIPERTILIEA